MCLCRSIVYEHTGPKTHDTQHQPLFWSDINMSETFPSVLCYLKKKSTSSLLELGDICIIVCFGPMVGCKEYMVGALRGNCACTMYTLSCNDLWWRQWG